MARKTKLPRETPFISMTGEGSNPPRRAIGLTTARSRRGADALVGALRAAGKGNLDLTIVETTPTPLPLGSLEEMVRDHDAVVAVGGDGTVGQALTGMGTADRPLGIIPGGSTNIIARELGIPRDSHRAAAVIAGAHALMQLDVAVCNDAYFLHMAGAGFDSRMFTLTPRERKQRFGWLAYLPSAAKSLGQPAARFRVEVDEGRFEVVSPLVLVANGAGIVTPRLPVHGTISPRDGLLDVLIVTATERRAILSVVGRFATLQLQRSPHVVHARTRAVRLASEPVLPVQLDGDVVGETPVTMSIRPWPATLIVPSGRLPIVGEAREA